MIVCKLIWVLLLEVLEFLIYRFQVLWFDEQLVGVGILAEIEWEYSLIEVKIWLLKDVPVLNIKALCRGHFSQSFFEIL